LPKASILSRHSRLKTPAKMYDAITYISSMITGLLKYAIPCKTVFARIQSKINASNLEERVIFFASFLMNEIFSPSILTLSLL